MTPADLAAKGLRVKPLVWKNYDDESFAEPYQIEARTTGDWRVYILTGYESADPILTSAGERDHPTRESAIAAAEAHHAARVAEMIEATESVAQVLGPLADRQQRLGPEAEAAIFSDLDGQ
jgi:hypothetical protein